MRFREDTPEEQARARTEVAAWREANPDGTVDGMLAALGPGFHKDYGPVLRAALYRADEDRAQIAGTAPGMEAVPLSAVAGRTDTVNTADRVHGSPSGRAGDGGAVASVPPSPGRGRDAR
jgi:hypothetical protein